MVFPEDDQDVNTDMRGLSIPNSWKLLTALRFYGTGCCYQVITTFIKYNLIKLGINAV